MKFRIGSQDAQERKIHQSNRWTQLARSIKKQAGFDRCKNCYDNKSLNGYDLEADHIIPISKGGAHYDLRNIQVLCRECHRIKGDLSNPAGVAMRRGGITEADVVGEVVGYQKFSKAFWR